MARTEAVGVAGAETDMLAREMADSYRELVEFWRDRLGLPVEEAEARVREARGVEASWLTARPQQTSWRALALLTECNPTEAQAVWEAVKARAGRDLESGVRAAESIAPSGGPWARAEFLTLRAGLLAEWGPVTGTERALVDVMAQAYTCCLFWLGRLHTMATTEGRTEEAEQRGEGYWRPPRVETAEAMEQAAAMVERFHRLFLRTLRALRDLRRYAPKVVIGSAAQVNIGEQQVNVAQS